MSVEEHKKHRIENVSVGVLTVSSTRTKQDDWSGRWIIEQAGELGYRIGFYEIVKDHVEIIQKTVLTVIAAPRPDILLVTGGTGLDPADVTIEAVKPLFEKELTAFSAVFAQLSYSEIGSAAIISRATAGIVNSSAVFCMPGSLKACRTACEKIIFPEIQHIVKHLRRNLSPDV